MLRDRKALVAVVLVFAAIAAVATSSSSAKTSDHRGGTLKLLAKAAGGTLDPQVNYTLQYWQLYQATYDGLLGFKKAGGDAAFKVVPDLASGFRADERRQDLDVQAAQGDQVLERPAGDGRTTSSPRSGASSRSRARPPAASTPASSARRRASKTPATCTLKGGVSRQRRKADTVTINLIAPDPEFKYKLAVPHASILPASAPPNDAGTKPIPATGAYYFASYNPNKQLVHEAQPVLQGVVEGRAAGRLSGPDHAVVRADRRGADHGDRERPGRLDARGSARRPAERDRHEVREPGARRAADGVLVRADELEPGAVQQPEGAPGGQLRDRPERARQDLRRPEARDAVVPGAAAGLPGPQGLLPVHEEPRHEVVGARRREGEAARQGVRHRGTEGRRRSRRTTRCNKAMGVYLQSVLNQIGYKATRQADLGEHLLHLRRRTRRTRCRSTCSSGTRTTRLRRTSSTSCSAASRSIRAATRASTSRASATRRSTRRCSTALKLARDRRAGARTRCGRRSTGR